MSQAFYWSSIVVAIVVNYHLSEASSQILMAKMSNSNFCRETQCF